MPYVFNPSALPTTEESNPVVGFLRSLLNERLLIITESELQHLSSRDRRYFTHISGATAIEMVERLAQALRAEDDSRRRGEFSQQAANARANVQARTESSRLRADIEAAQTVEMVRSAIGARQLRAAEEMTNAVTRRRRRPEFHGQTTHSNEGDIEPEDL